MSNQIMIVPRYVYSCGCYMGANDVFHHDDNCRLADHQHSPSDIIETYT